MLPPYLPCALGQSMAKIRVYSATYCQDNRSDCQESLVQPKTRSTLPLPTLRDPADLSKHRLCEEWLYLLEPSCYMAASYQQQYLDLDSGESSHAHTSTVQVSDNATVSTPEQTRLCFWTGKQILP